MHGRLNSMFGFRNPDATSQIHTPGTGHTTMKTQAHAKALETKKAKTAQFASQTIKVDDNWKIVRADELNWEVQFKGKFKGYFGRLIDAFRALPAKMLGEEAQGTVADLTGLQKAINEHVENALIDAAKIASLLG